MLTASTYVRKWQEISFPSFGVFLDVFWTDHVFAKWMFTAIDCHSFDDKYRNDEIIPHTSLGH